jgi:F-type H+-transporting ATPase subunit c
MSMNTIAAALAVLPLGLVALAMGSIFNKAIESIARNPGATDPIRKLVFIGFAVVESVALIAFVVAVLILFK